MKKELHTEKDLREAIQALQDDIHGRLVVVFNMLDRTESWTSQHNNYVVEQCALERVLSYGKHLGLFKD